MKKVITFVMLFVMIICSSALADPDFIGAWATVRDLDNSVTEIVILRVFPNNKVYYSRQQFTENSIGEEEKHLYTWEAENDQIFQLINDAGDVIDRCGLIGDRRLLGRADMFARFDYYARETTVPDPDPTPAPLDNLETGFLLDPGQYIVGVDLPAGDYRFEYYENTCDIFVHKNPDSSLWSAYASVSRKSPVYAKLNLPEGARLDINAYPVIIMYARPLNLGE